MFGLGTSKPAAQSDIVTVKISGCAAASGGVGIDLTHENIILDIRPDTAAFRAAESGASFIVGDRVLSVDGTRLNGRVLTDVIQPGDEHTFEVDRTQGWSGFSIEETPVSEQDEDGFAALNRVREVVVQKKDGQLGINPEVHCPDGQSAVVKVAKVYEKSHASLCGVVSIGDVILAINGQSLKCDPSENPLTAALAVLHEVKDGVDITLELESDVLHAGWMQKKGEKGFLGAKSSWQKRWMMLVWSETNMAEREIRYFEGQDFSTRKQKGAIDLSRATDVTQKEIEGAAGLSIETPGRVWELLPNTREEAIDWYVLLNQLLQRKRGLAVVSSMSELTFNGLAAEEQPTPGELTVVLQRKLGMSINKLGNEIVIAELEPDGAAAACGLLSKGDALDEVNGVKTESCRQTIKQLMDNPSLAQLKVFSKVVHGGWMHKLGEGLGGWTTRYFTLTYELDPSAVPKGASGNTTKIESKLDAKRERPRAASIAAGKGTSMVLVHLHKANRADKLGVSLAEDDDGKVVLQRIYEGYVAANSAALMVGDILVSINGKPVINQPTAHRYLSEAHGPIELNVHRSTESGCWMLRYYDSKNSGSRVEKGCIKLSKGTVREINKYTLQEEGETDVPRVGLYILQDERCWELLPPEEELDVWISKLQLAVFGQEVIAEHYVSPEKAAASAAKVRDLKGAHYLTLQQQYGLMLATYKDRAGPDAQPSQLVSASSKMKSTKGGGGDEGAPPAEGAAAAAGGAAEETPPPVYIMSMEMDGAGACSGLLCPNDRVLEVDGARANTLAQVTTAFRESRDTVKLKVASNVVYGGYLLKKGEMNTQLQLRWFLLFDRPEGSCLEYYEGKNSVSRVYKGEIKITPHDVSSVRTFTHDGGGERRLAVRITTSTRAWELVSFKNDSDARRWAELLNARIRKRVHRPTISAMADSTEAQAAATIGSKEAGVIPETTRL